MPRVTFACMDCGFGCWDMPIAGNHAVTLPRHTVYLMRHTLVDEEPKLRLITGFGSHGFQKAHYSRNGHVSICGMLKYANPLPGPVPLETLPLCGHCRKMEPDAYPA